MNGKQIVGAAARAFLITGEFAGAAPYGSGHINDTYCAVFGNGGGEHAVSSPANQSPNLQESRHADGEYRAGDSASRRAGCGSIRTATDAC